jgi:hypothetical protein
MVPSRNTMIPCLSERTPSCMIVSTKYRPFVIMRYDVSLGLRCKLSEAAVSICISST